MHSSFLLVFILNVVGVPIGIWARVPLLLVEEEEETVLKYEPQLTDNEKNLTLLFPELIQLHWHQQNEILHKLSDVNGNKLKLDFKDCGNDFSTIRFLKLMVAPDPVVTPGQITMSFQVEFKEEITDRLKANVKLTRKLGPGSIKIPCIGSVGSCVYDDICEKLKLIQKCPKPFVEYGFNCKCPFKKGLISIPAVHFTIGRNVVPSGQYTLHVLLHHRGAFAGCLKLTLSFSTP